MSVVKVRVMQRTLCTTSLRRVCDLSNYFDLNDS
jgi:hypothetical protein